MSGTNLLRSEAEARAAAFSVANYNITLDLTGKDANFTSRTVVTFACSDTSIETFIDLIAPEVQSVTLNGTALNVAEVVSEGRIALPGLAAQNTLEVVAQCEYMRTGEGLHRIVDPVDDETYLYSQFEVADARRVFACFDQPDLKATYDFTMHTPDHWTAISLMPTPEPQAGPTAGTSTWVFETTPMVSTYVTSVIAGPYHMVRDELKSSDGRTIPLAVACRKSMSEHLDAENIIEVTKQGFDFFENLWGVPYPFTKYDQIFVPEFNAGAMENAGAVTFTEMYVFRSAVPASAIERRALTVLHELAHMWFGDLVTMRWWDDLWLNESFAEYTSTRCQSVATQWESSWTTFSIVEKSWAYRQDQLASTHPIWADIRDLEDVLVNFDGITYAKGASVLKQLVHWVGQDAFDQGLREYFRKHAWKNTTLNDLMVELEAASGRDLSNWTELWLKTAGVATLSPEASYDGDVLTELKVKQTGQVGHDTLRPHRIGIGGYDMVDGSLQRTWHVECDIDGAESVVAQAAGKPRPALLLLNDEDLAYAKIRLDADSLATATEHLSDFAESLPAALVWGAAWDMTRDAELGARQFIDLLLGNILSVSDPNVQMILLRQLSGTLHSFVAAEHREATQAQVSARLLELVQKSEAGSNLQLLLVRSLAEHAVGAAELDFVAGLLDGTQSLPGRDIDTDLRWDLLVSLVAAGRRGAADIDAEFERDKTASGEVRAAAARAAVPSAEAKQAAWKAVVTDGNLVNSVQAATIGGFNRVHDRTLLAEFMEPYFTAIGELWNSRTKEMSSQIIEMMYPAHQPLDAVLARTDAWLADNAAAEPALRRMVIEGRDSVVRAMAAQAKDRG